MKTIEHFNEIVNVWQTPPGSPVVVGVGDGRESIRSLSEEPGRGIEVFRDMIGYGVYQHVALIDNGRVLAIWHAQSVTVPAQAAGYTYPELLDKYFPGEPEEMKQPSITDASPGYSEKPPAQPVGDFGVGDVVTHVDCPAWGKGTILRLMPDGEKISVKFEHLTFARKINADKLTLWKPAEPGSDAKDEYTRDEEQARLIARIRELEEAIEDIKETAEYRLEDWIAVQVQYLPGHMVGYRLILNKANEALAEAQEETR